MAMDRAEILGFGAAVGGHALLLGLFALGLMASAQTAPKPQSLSLSLSHYQKNYYYLILYFSDIFLSLLFLAL